MKTTRRPVFRQEQEDLSLSLSLGNESKISISLTDLNCVQGSPSGEAFIQMDSEYAAELASTTKTRKLYVINGAKRYVDVIQCSGDDMNVALNTGLAPPSPAGNSMPHTV